MKKKKKNGLVVEPIGLSSSAVRLMRFFAEEEKIFLYSALSHKCA